ncbi:MAG: SOS response-associated peptidase [Rhodocyclaceae bacterium]|nr:SOS response-associated peptidase [Rhodocyclaceae bacterium]
MCGRYALYGPHARHREHFDAMDSFALPPRFNIAPSLLLPVVQQAGDGSRHFVLAKWGLIPYWVKDPAQVQHPINAKAETAAIKPMFRQAFRKSRVLVPADHFYEWKAVGGKKQPYLIQMRDGAPFGMAGLLERWPGPQGEVVTFAILTTEANPLVADLHNRMLAIIRPEDYGAWLDPTVSDVEKLLAMLGPYPERLMESYAVSRKLSNPANEGPDLIERVT